MNVVILFRYFWPESRVSEEPHMLRDLVHWHASRGDSVQVVCGSHDDCRERWASEFPDRVRIDAFRAGVDRDGPFLGRVVNSARMLFHGMATLLAPRRIDLLYLFTYPPGFAGAMIALCRLLRRRTTIVFSFQDNLEYRIRNPVVRFLYRRYNAFCISHATFTMVLSSEMRDHLLESVRKGARESVERRVEVVNNFYAERIEPVDESSGKTYDIIYAGNHGPGQNLDFFVEVLARCRTSPPPRVVFYGSGTAKTDVIALAAERNAAIEFRDPVDRRHIAAEIRRARFGLVAMRPDLPKYAFPSKIIAYTSNGTRALLMCDPNGALSRWIRDEGLGVALDALDVESAGRDLEEALSAPDIPAARDVASRAAEIFGRERFLQRVDDMLRRPPS